MEKEGARRPLLDPATCFPLIFTDKLDLVKSPDFGIELEVRLRALFREARSAELVALYTSTQRALGDGSLALQCGALIDKILDPPPSSTLVSPLEQTMHAAIATRMQPPRDLAPVEVFARNMAPLCYALYLAVECVTRIPLAEWTLASAVQLLFGLEQTIESALKEKDRVLYGTSDALASALDAASPRVRQRMVEVLTALRTTAPELDKQLIDAWLKPGAGQPREGQRKKLLDRIGELMAMHPEQEQEETEAEMEEDEEDNDEMDLSARGLTRPSVVQ